MAELVLEMLMSALACSMSASPCMPDDPTLSALCDTALELRREDSGLLALAALLGVGGITGAVLELAACAAAYWAAELRVDLL